MQTDHIFVAHTTNLDQIKALKAVVKALNVKFEIKKESIVTVSGSEKKRTLQNIRQGFKELKLINEGKLKTTPATDFLNEL